MIEWDASLAHTAAGALGTGHDLEAALGHAVSAGDRQARAALWLSLTVLQGRLPFAGEVESAARRARLGGSPHSWLGGTHVPRRQRRRQKATGQAAAASVKIISDRILVDVTHTSSHSVNTGIQRVVRNTLAHWTEQGRPIELAVFDDREGCYRAATAGQRALATGAAEPEPRRHSVVPELVIPWKTTVLIPELAGEYDRSRRLLAVARHSGNRVGLIGFDCVPVSTPESVDLSAVPPFYKYLSWVKESDRVATISKAAQVEFSGFVRMLGALGTTGPTVVEVPLPAEVPESTEAEISEARSRLHATVLPLVLVVGSHEPRKNHLAVLHAAELLWRRGHAFTLAFVGGNAWKSETFDRRVSQLQASGRPIDVVRSLDDGLLWAAYRSARFTVFPSLNEGFGLPVAESLAAGTPAITSNYGSMAEIAADGGTLLVDPRDDHALAAAMARLLDDDALLDLLRRQALDRPHRTWDNYASQLWEALVES